jgi:hypothetical protein
VVPADKAEGAGYGFRKETIAGVRDNGRDAPMAAVRLHGFERTLRAIPRPRPWMVAPARERTFVPDFGT